MTWSIELHHVERWLAQLDVDSYEQVIAALELLAEHGRHLGRPLADSISGSRHHNMKELRPGSAGRSELRMLFAFDPRRIAVGLAAGDKSGNWARWHRHAIPEADTLFDEHLRRYQGEST